MKITRALLIGGLVTSLPAWAVYAPVPEQDQGKAWTVSLMAGISHDSNIFGARSSEISSMVYTASPKVAFNASVTDQTFLSASYQLTVDHFTDRPGDKTLDSHALAARVAHAFTKTTTLDVSDDFSIIKNPAVILAGLPLNSDQSYDSNEFNVRFNTTVTAKAGLTVKARSMLYRYDDGKLGTSLDRTENLYGISGNYDLQPDLKGVAEYRHETIDYRHSGDNKDKTSDFLLGGGDYEVGKQLTASARLGVEYRKRDTERSATSPYAEISGKYDYAQGSFVTAGYVYTFEETSNVALYTDTQVNRFFFNIQHAVTALIAVSASADYEPSTLEGRRGFSNQDETTTRLGFAVSYLPTKNWTISASFDHDNVTSGDASREFTRDRYGLTGTYTF